MRRTSAVVLVASLLFLAVASPASAQSATPSRESDASIRERHAIGNTTWMTGLGVVLGTWLVTGVATTTVVQVANARTITIAESWIPVAGPWMMVADSRGFTDVQFTLSIVSGVIQALGCAAFVTGLVLENAGPSPTTSESTTATARLWVLPTATANGGGLSLAGAF